MKPTGIDFLPFREKKGKYVSAVAPCHFLGKKGKDIFATALCQSALRGFEEKLFATAPCKFLGRNPVTKMQHSRIPDPLVTARYLRVANVLRNSAQKYVGSIMVMPYR